MNSKRNRRVLLAVSLVAALTLVGMLLFGPLRIDSRVRGSDDRAENDSTITADERIELAEAEWRNKLTPEQFYVLREGGTEQSGTGQFAYHHVDGLYVCAGCDSPLFDSADKFESGTGWPSYTRPARGSSVGERDDSALLFIRTEVYCRKCDGHLGHVFDDGPQPTGLRYCINSAALSFKPR